MDSTRFINHKTILTSLERTFKEKQFDEEDILNWCQEVETLYIADPSSMVAYMEIPLAVSNFKVVLPSNIYKIRDVYFNKESYGRIAFQQIGIYLSVPNYTEDKLYINYVGTPLDKDCLPLIHKDHQAACETYCKINSFEEDALLGQINMSVFADWKQRFDGMIQSAKVSFRDWDNSRYERMNIIMGSQIPRVGYVPMANSQFEGESINDQPNQAYLPTSNYFDTEEE